MITIFNRAILCREPSAEAAAKVWSALRKEKIPYEIKTKVSGAAKPAAQGIPAESHPRFVWKG